MSDDNVIDLSKAKSSRSAFEQVRAAVKEQLLLNIDLLVEEVAEDLVIAGEPTISSFVVLHDIVMAEECEPDDGA